MGEERPVEEAAASCSAPLAQAPAESEAPSTAAAAPEFEQPPAPAPAAPAELEQPQALPAAQAEPSQPPPPAPSPPPPVDDGRALVPEAVSGGARLPALEVSGGAALIDGQPATSDALFDHVINHLDRLDGVLDERAAELEARSRRLEELAADGAREARVAAAAALAADRASVAGALGLALTRARDDTWAATRQLGSAVSDFHYSVIDAAPAPIQSLQREVDRVLAPVHAATRGLLGLQLEQPSSFKGRRSAYADDVEVDAAKTVSGGNNFDALQPVYEEVGAAERHRRDN